MHRDDEVELQEIENDEVGHQEMEEEEMEQVERGEKLYLYLTCTKNMSNVPYLGNP